MDILHRVGIHASPAAVFAALATVDGLSGWWTEDTSGDGQAGGRLDFQFQDAAGQPIGGFGMSVAEATPAQRVRWRVQDGPADWVGTDIEFELSEQDGQTIVQFGHRRWRDASEFMSHCSTKWATFLLSLRDYVETGRGRPAPNDQKISNWH